jgi:hypothetical protein
MARPIESTPRLRGKDAEAMLQSMRMDEPVSVARLRWLSTVAEMSRAAEGGTSVKRKVKHG